MVQFAEGIGFIQPGDGSKDVFVHITALEHAGLWRAAAIAASDPLAETCPYRMLATRAVPSTECATSCIVQQAWRNHC